MQFPNPWVSEFGIIAQDWKNMCSTCLKFKQFLLCCCVETRVVILPFSKEVFKSSLKLNTTFLPFSPCKQGKMCLIKTFLSKITYSFQILFKLELRLLLVCFFLPFSLWKITSSPSLKARTEILQKISIAFWTMEFQKKSFEISWHLVFLKYM